MENNNNSYENYCIARDRLGYSDYKVGTLTGIGTATLSNWKNGKYVPKTDKIQKIAELLGTTENFILYGETSDEEKYYINEETAEIAQALFENKNLRLLFDVAKDADPDVLKATSDMLLAMKKKERHE